MPTTVYILRCAEGSYCVGATSDLERRMQLHESGEGPVFTRSRRPVELVHIEEFDTWRRARQRERQLKRWSRARKQALIDGRLGDLKAHSRRRR